MIKEAKLSDLLGVTLEKIEVSQTLNESNFIVFTAMDGRVWEMCHNQDCCEDVHIDDINGNVQHLVGQPILMAESVSGAIPDEDPLGDSEYVSYTYTFYKFATIYGFVDVRWLGRSNGRYSEEVTFCLTKDATND